MDHKAGRGAFRSLRVCQLSDLRFWLTDFQSEAQHAHLLRALGRLEAKNGGAPSADPAMMDTTPHLSPLMDAKVPKLGSANYFSDAGGIL